MRIWVARHQWAGAYSAMPKQERDRELLPEGRMAALKMGAEMSRRGYEPGIVLTSPYARTLQTGDIYAAALGTDCDVVDALGPHFGPLDWFLDLLDSRDTKRPMIVGHSDNLNKLFGEDLGGDWEPLVIGEVRQIKIGRKTLDWAVRDRILPSELGEEDRLDGESPENPAPDSLPPAVPDEDGDYT